MLTDLEKNAIRDHYQNIGKNLPGFRPRASQREMIAAIANAFSRTLTREEGEEAPKREGESIAVIEGRPAWVNHWPTFWPAASWRKHAANG